MEGNQRACRRNQAPTCKWPQSSPTEGLARTGQSVPVALVLDDLQWADPQTLSVLFGARSLDGRLADASRRSLL